MSPSHSGSPAVGPPPAARGARPERREQAPVAGSTLPLDALLTLLFVLLEFGNIASVVLAPEVYRDMLPPEGLRTSLPLSAAAAVAVCLPAVWRRRAPVPVLVSISVLTALATALLGLPLGWWAALAALYEVALRRERAFSVAALVAVTLAAFGALLVGFASMTAFWVLSTVLSYPLIFGSAWLLGWRARRRRLRERELEAREQARSLRTVAEERGRTARQLHDILAHSIGVMVAAASDGRAAGRRAPDRVGEALAHIETTGRESMVEVRRLLGLLRGEVVDLPLAPQPGLDRLDELLDDARARGLTIDVAVEGTPQPLDPSVDLSAYRILEEALDNVVKHAGPAEVALRLSYTDTLLALDVRDRGGRDPWGPSAPDHGAGLLGMRERALLVGGTLRAGPTDEGFAVRAELPLSAHAPLLAQAGPGAP